MSQVNRTREHELVDPDDDKLLAKPDEEMEAKIEIDKIQRFTVEPGVMQLPVDQVTTAENSENWAIDLDHPVEGQLRVFVSKPETGWDQDHEMVKLLNWYSIDNNDMYALQLKRLYVEYAPDESERAHGWRLTEPPISERDAGRVERLRHWVRSRTPSLSVLTPIPEWLWTGVGSLIGTMIVLSVFDPGMVAYTIMVVWTLGFAAAGQILSEMEDEYHA